jgi:ribonuclease HI
MLTSPSDARAHYLLFSEANAGGGHGVWRFVLDKVGEESRLSVADAEPLECRERLELLAVVRGLEALDEPSRVTLVTKSRYVSRGLRRGLAEWRANGWQWECFGRLVPVRDHDLWRRVARALEFHQIECRVWRFDGESRVAVSGAASQDSSPAGRLAAAARQRWQRAAASLEGALCPTGLAAG